jgi:hypothetical protein
LRNERNETVFFTYDDQNKLTLEDRKRKQGRYISTCKIPRDFLNDNSFSVLVKGTDEQTSFFEETGCSFDVDESMDPNGSRGIWTIGTDGKWPRLAVVRPKLEWDIRFDPF